VKHTPFSELSEGGFFISAIGRMIFLHNMNFEQSHSQFIEEHLQYRSGESRRGLLKGHGFAETLFLKQVWWPAFGHFQWLYPEYPVEDWRG
jgi:hypothetical protein